MADYAPPTSPTTIPMGEAVGKPPFTLDMERFTPAITAFLEHAPGAAVVVSRAGLEAALIQALKAYGALDKRTLIGFGAENARKTHCPKGHPLTEDNLRPWDLQHQGRRKCKICANERTRARKAKS